MVVIHCDTWLTLKLLRTAYDFVLISLHMILFWSHFFVGSSSGMGRTCTKLTWVLLEDLWLGLGVGNFFRTCNSDLWLFSIHGFSSPSTSSHFSIITDLHYILLIRPDYTMRWRIEDNLPRCTRDSFCWILIFKVQQNGSLQLLLQVNNKLKFQSTMIFIEFFNFLVNMDSNVFWTCDSDSSLEKSKGLGTWTQVLFEDLMPIPGHAWSEIMLSCFVLKFV